MHLPSLGALVVDCAGDARVERDVLAEIESVGDVVDVVQNFFLGAEFLRPVPFLL